MGYLTSEVIAAREHVYNAIWQGTDISESDIAYAIVDYLLSSDYISDVLFQEIKEETNA